MPKGKITVTQRSSEGLKEMLFEQLDGLRNSTTDLHTAREIGRIAHQINQANKNDLELAKFLTNSFPGIFDDRIRDLLQIESK